MEGINRAQEYLMQRVARLGAALEKPEASYRCVGQTHVLAIGGRRLVDLAAYDKWKKQTKNLFENTYPYDDLVFEDDGVFKAVRKVEQI